MPSWGVLTTLSERYQEWLARALYLAVVGWALVAGGVADLIVRAILRLGA
jgi:hypothetical protein